ncbi:MAG: phosphotransferase [Pleurocapsa sp.]
MAFILSSENVLAYLTLKGICQPEQQLIEVVESDQYKNFNLIVNVTENDHYLVKQERLTDKDNLTFGNLNYELALHQLIKNFPELEPIQTSTSQVVKFDPENSIIVIRYLPDHLSLAEFYERKQEYPPQIASLLGNNLAQLHRLTLEQTKYREFLIQQTGQNDFGNAPLSLRGLARVGPGIFGNICSNGIDFFKLYQRFPSLHQAVSELHGSYQSVCLTHCDLNFSNYLIENQDDISAGSQIKLIDWEFLNWGDPAFDLGILVAKYLKLWLNSLFVDSDTELNLALSLALCPLEKVQPSLSALLKGYLAEFPEVLAAIPNFLTRVIQFAGLDLIKSIQHKIEHHRAFNNRDICSLQVAKSLLCQPEESMATIFSFTDSKAVAAV